MVMEMAPFDDQQRQGVLDAVDSLKQAAAATAVSVGTAQGFALDAFASALVALHETGQSPSQAVVADGLAALGAVARGDGAGGSTWQAELEAMDLVSGGHLLLFDPAGGRRMSVYVDAARTPYMGVLSLVGPDAATLLSGGSSLPSSEPRLMLAFTVVREALGSSLRVSDGPRDVATVPMDLPPLAWTAAPQLAAPAEAGSGGGWGPLIEAGAAGAAAAVAAGMVAGMIDRRAPSTPPAAPVHTPSPLAMPAVAPPPPAAVGPVMSSAWEAVGPVTPPPPNPVAPTPPPARFCSNCGAPRAGVGRFCEQCGTRFSA